MGAKLAGAFVSLPGRCLMPKVCELYRPFLISLTAAIKGHCVPCCCTSDNYILGGLSETVILFCREQKLSSNLSILFKFALGKY